jgi:predicted transposase YbfD/YdcC
VYAFAIEPLKADFPFARSLIVVRNTRWIKKTNHSTTESHYYLSSALPQHYRPPQWLTLIRGHWAGVEIRNHWRRDVLFGEDASRSRNPNLLANLALIRSALLALLAEHFPNTAAPPVIEQLARNTNHALKILCT